MLAARQGAARVGRLLALLSLLALFGVAGAAAAQEPVDPAALPNAAVAQAAIAQLRSPYCPGLMLEVCPSPQAGLLRDSIRELAAEGESADEIVEWMLARHGEEWRAVPKQSGRGLWAWLIPPMVLLVGAGFVAHRLRSRQPEPEVAYTPPVLSGEERDRLTAALRQWEEHGEESDA